MQTTITYKGILNGVYGIFCGFKPEGLEVIEEVTVYKPDNGKVFKKDDKEYTAIILKEDINIADYEEVESIENN